jgi:hypothetical protein
MKKKITFGISKEEKKNFETLSRDNQVKKISRKKDPSIGNKMLISPIPQETTKHSNNEIMGVLSKMNIDSDEIPRNNFVQVTNANSNCAANPPNIANINIDKKQNLIIPVKNQNSLTNPPINQNNKEYYIERENQHLINKYGPEIYDYSKELENESVFKNLLQRHKVDPNVRTKMIDWMIEVLYAYHSDSPTLFLAVHLFDLYIFKSDVVLTNNDIHLTGIVCLYLASKMEDLVPLRMSHVKAKIGHNKFSEKKIREKEKVVLNTINFKMISTSTYDFVKTFIYDFYHNNQESIKQLNMYKHIDCFENICLFLSKLMFHNEEFSSYKYSLKAIASIVTAFDILRSNAMDLSKDAENFMRQWVNYFVILTF